MKRIISGLAIAALLIGQAEAAVSVTQNNAQIPTSGSLIPFDFANDGTNTWPLHSIWDGTTIVTVNATSKGLSIALPTTPSLANGSGVVPTQGGSVLSATNGMFSNLLQGNAVLSATNGLFVAPTSAASWTITGTVNPTTAANWGLLADNGAWSSGSTLGEPVQCEFTSGGATTLTTAHAGVVGCTSARAFFTDKTSVAGSSLATATEAYGTNFTSQTGTVERVDAYVTNTNNNGPALAANSSPVVAQGQQATGSALSNNNPVLTGGSDGSNVRNFLTSSTGHLVIDCNSAGGTCAGSGGTASTFGSAFPTTGTAIGLTNGTNMLAWSATSNYGTSPGAIAVPSVNAAVTNSITIGTNAALVAGAATIGKVDILGNAGGTLDTAAGTGASTGFGVQGLSAAAATDSDVPINNGGRAATTQPTAVTDGQKVAMMMSVQGKTITLPYAPSGLVNNANGPSTSTTAITVQAASGSASYKEYMTKLHCGRSDAGTTAITLAISDGTTTVTEVLPNNGGGGQANFSFDPPLAWVVNHAVTVVPSSGVTTLYCDAEGFNAS